MARSQRIVAKMTEENTVTAPLAKRQRKCSGKCDTDATSITAELIPKPTALQCTSDWCSMTFGPLLEDSSTHDVVFKASDGGSVGAHRLIVAAGSPVSVPCYVVW